MVTRSQLYPVKSNSLWLKILLAVLGLAIVASILMPVFSQSGSRKKPYTLTNVKIVVLGVILFANDYDDYTPDLYNGHTIREMLHPYVNDNSRFYDIEDKQPILFNAALSRVKLGDIKHPETTVLAYAANVRNGLRVVGFADGHAKQIPESDFANLMAKAGNYEPGLGPLLGKWKTATGTITFTEPDIATVEGSPYKGIATYSRDQQLSVKFGGLLPDVTGRIAWRSLKEFQVGSSSKAEVFARLPDDQQPSAVKAN
jgi:hypothetical protein